MTVTGVEVEAVGPPPRSQVPTSPQHLTLPDDMTAQLPDMFVATPVAPSSLLRVSRSTWGAYQATSSLRFNAS